MERRKRIGFDRLSDATYELLFGIARSALYHEKRRIFYRASLLAHIPLILLIGHALKSAGANADVVNTLTLATAVFVSVGSLRKASLHQHLQCRFERLLPAFFHGPHSSIPISPGYAGSHNQRLRNLTQAERGQLTNERLAIESDEPPVTMRLLDALCHFQLLSLWGDTGKRPQIPWWRKFLSNWMSQRGYTFFVLKPAVEGRGA